MPNCLNCKIKLKDNRSKRCYKCSRLGELNPMFGKKRSLEARLKTSIANKNNPNCAWAKGKHLSLEHRKSISNGHKKRVVEGKHNFYIDGRSKNYVGTNARKILHNTLEYRIWREAVFARDNWTCLSCGARDGRYLEADHIKPWSMYPEFRYAIDNGRTLCKNCHMKTDTWGIKALNYKEVAKNS